MNNSILKVKTEFKYKVMFVLIGIVCLAMSFYIIVMAGDSRGKMKGLNFLISAVGAGMGIFAILQSFIHCSGYLNIYRDHIEGKGIRGKGMNTFYLANKQVKSMTEESYYLCIHTEVGDYKIICSKKSRQEAIRYFLQNNMQ